MAHLGKGKFVKNNNKIGKNVSKLYQSIKQNWCKKLGQIFIQQWIENG